MKKTVDSRRHTEDRGSGMMARARRQNPPALVPLLKSEFRDPQSFEATCIGCGCSDSHACVTVRTIDDPVSILQGCFWVKVDYELRIGVCSECVENIEEYEERINAARLVSRKGAPGIDPGGEDAA